MEMFASKSPKGEGARPIWAGEEGRETANKVSQGEHAWFKFRFKIGGVRPCQDLNPEGVAAAQAINSVVSVAPAEMVHGLGKSAQWLV